MLTFKWMRPLLGVCLLVLAPLAQGVMCEEAWKVETKGNTDYAAAVKAVERKDWAGAVAALGKVLERRSWDDDAHTLLGFAYRKLGNYQAALDHYHAALELNPYHLGAMEYLGEAYLDLGARRRATETLEQLAAACRRVGPRSDTSKKGCPRWRELKAAIEAQSAQGEAAY
jgi:tetratricopeptide (TPR) repeat protein